MLRFRLQRFALSRHLAVEGDGRLVPATDDEVMEVEDLVEDDKNEVHFVAHAGQIARCTSICDVLSEKTTLNNSKGLTESKDPKAEREKLNAPHGTALDLGKSDIQPEEIAILSASSSNDSQIGQTSDKEHLQPPRALIGSAASTSNLGTSLKPDFSKLNGNICLDNLSVKELQETFKATCGRETSVKDKQWLKRRISMGLSNSCDVSSTTFVIRDSRVVRKWKSESCKNTATTAAKEPLVRLMNDDHGDTSLSLGDQIDNQLNICGKLLSTVTNSGHGELFPPAHTRPAQNVTLASRLLVTSKILLEILVFRCHMFLESEEDVQGKITRTRGKGRVRVCVQRSDSTNGIFAGNLFTTKEIPGSEQGLLLVTIAALIFTIAVLIAVAIIFL